MYSRIRAKFELSAFLPPPVPIDPHLCVLVVFVSQLREISAKLQAKQLWNQKCQGSICTLWIDFVARMPFLVLFVCLHNYIQLNFKFNSTTWVHGPHSAIRKLQYDLEFYHTVGFRAKLSLLLLPISIYPHLHIRESPNSLCLCFVSFLSELWRTRSIFGRMILGLNFALEVERK